MRGRLLAILFILSMVTAGCSLVEATVVPDTPVPHSPTATPTLASTLTITPTPSVTPSPTTTPTPSTNLTQTASPTPTALPTPTPRIPSESVPELEGLQKRWFESLGTWYYIDAENQEGVAYWVPQGSGAGHVELLLPGSTFSMRDWQLKGKWQGLFYRAEADELEALFERQRAEQVTVYILPVDPTIEGMTVTFRSPGWGGSVVLLVDAPSQVLVRIPVAGIAYPVEYGTDPAVTEGQKAFLEYATDQFLTTGSLGHKFFDDVYRFLPTWDSEARAGEPWVLVPPGENGLASLRVDSTYVLRSWDPSDQGRMWGFLYPANLLRTEDGRIVYLAQEDWSSSEGTRLSTPTGEPTPDKTP